MKVQNTLAAGQFSSILSKIVSKEQSKDAENFLYRVSVCGSSSCTTSEVSSVVSESRSAPEVVVLYLEPSVRLLLFLR